MFQNAALDIAMGLVVMYLLLSLTCTVINEYIAAKLNLRSRSLQVGLQELLDDPDIRKAFYQHGLVAGTKTAVTKAREMPLAGSAPAPEPQGAVVKNARHPQYLSTETFVLALVGALFGGQSKSGQPIPGFADVQTAIQNLPASKIKDALVSSLTVAQGNFDEFRKHVATWFDDSMDRLSGAYRRHLKVISLVVGCLLAVILNADTFEVGRALWSDGALRAQMIQVAETIAKPQTGSSGDASPGKTERQLGDVRASFQNASDTLRPLPIGWSKEKFMTLPWELWLLKLVGLFFTGLALSLGAPFWFDTLSKFMNVRAAGVKPERKS